LKYRMVIKDPIKSLQTLESSLDVAIASARGYLQQWNRPATAVIYETTEKEICKVVSEENSGEIKISVIRKEQKDEQAAS